MEIKIANQKNIKNEYRNNHWYKNRIKKMSLNVTEDPFIDESNGIKHGKLK